MRRAISLGELEPDAAARAQEILRRTGVRVPGHGGAPRKQPTQVEHAEQVALIEWSREPQQRARFPELQYLYAIPNQVVFASRLERGKRRSQVKAHRLLAEGLQPKFPDLCLPVPRMQASVHYCGLYAEMKRPDGGTLHARQRWWLEQLRQQGYATAVWRGFVEAREGLTTYLTGTWVAQPITTRRARP